MTKFTRGQVVIVRNPCAQPDYQERLGTVLHPNPPGMRGFVLIQFEPTSDGYCIPANQVSA